MFPPVADGASAERLKVLARIVPSTLTLPVLTRIDCESVKLPAARTFSKGLRDCVRLPSASLRVAASSAKVPACPSGEPAFRLGTVEPFWVLVAAPTVNVPAGALTEMLPALPP